MKQKNWFLALFIALGMSGLFFTACEKEEILTNEEWTATQVEPDIMFSNNNDIHVCIDKYLPSDSLEKAAVVPSRLWPVGQKLRVRFLGGDAYVQGKVMQFAKMWETYANVQFEQVTKGVAEIRIAFDEDDGSWSYIGKESMYIPQDSSSMNFGWFNSKTSDSEFRRTTLHEFGHALGMIHEHQQPFASIPWDTAAVYAYYMRPPNSWTKDDINQNIFERYSSTQTQFCNFDPLSIMEYPISNALTVGNFSVGINTNLSNEDKRFMGKMYPFSGLRGELKCKTYIQPAATAARNMRQVPSK